MRVGIDDMISVIMPAYNAEGYISKSIESVLCQTYKKFELIIVDDGSDDRTVNVIKEMQKKDARIILLYNDVNHGVSYSRNKGIQKAQADWIAFIDSDDMWRYDKLQQQVDFIKSNANADLVFTGSSFINETESVSKYILHVPPRINYHQLLKQNLISCSSVLVRKTLLESYQMKKDDLHEDFVAWLEMLRNGYQAYGIDEALLIYRLSPKSKSGNKWKSMVMTYKVYRHINLNIVSATYHMGQYVVRNLYKYYCINRGFKDD